MKDEGPMREARERAISRDVGVSDTNIKKYFSILEDTLLGFFLEAFQHSFRKRLSKSPKFYSKLIR